eukprot:6665739-Pyramimonas_sp.AAC.1
MGIDGLSSAEASRLKVGNASFHFTCRAPRLVALSRLPSFSSSICHMCQSGTPWKKPTRICAWH